ncbi:hypothetical protein PFISCL1PPCAC_9908, partial [Pristionchus fissidentatus]
MYFDELNRLYNSCSFSTRQHLRWEYTWSEYPWSVAYPSSLISFKYIFPLADEFEDVLGGLQLLCLSQWNLEGEFILDRHHDLHVIKGVEAKFSENSIQFEKASLVRGETIPCSYRFEHTLFNLFESELLWRIEGAEHLDTAQSGLDFEDRHYRQARKLDTRSDRETASSNSTAAHNHPTSGRTQHS